MSFPNTDSGTPERSCLPSKTWWRWWWSKGKRELIVDWDVFCLAFFSFTCLLTSYLLLLSHIKWSSNLSCLFLTATKYCCVVVSVPATLFFLSGSLHLNHAFSNILRILSRVSTILNCLLLLERMTQEISRISRFAESLTVLAIHEASPSLLRLLNDRKRSLDRKTNGRLDRQRDILSVKFMNEREGSVHHGRYPLEGGGNRVTWLPNVLMCLSILFLFFVWTWTV